MRSTAPSQSSSLRSDAVTSSCSSSEGMLRLPLAHSPRSINWQRSEQKGLCAFAAIQATALRQVGHWTIASVIIGKSQILLVKGLDLFVQRCRESTIINDVICERESRCAGRLRGNDRVDGLRGTMVSCRHSLFL